MAVVLGALTATAMALPAARADFGTSSVACGEGTVTYSPSNLWPPNHKMRTVTLKFEEAGTGEDNGNFIGLQVNSITYDEQGHEKGATARHSPDFTGVGNNDMGTDTVDGSDPATVTVQLRSERMGTDRDGRTYTINVTCIDFGEPNVTDPYNSASADLTVLVPHNR